MNFIFEEIKRSGIHFVDIGCSGSLPVHWRFLTPYLHYTGFDPNEEECERLNQIPSTYLSTRYLPYAIWRETGEALLYKTKYMGCYSLLHPRHDWLKRFKNHEYWQEIGEQRVFCTTLDALVRDENLKADIVKLDTQGTEVQILESSEHLLRDVICVDIETGFTPQYFNESLFPDIHNILRQKGFMLFDISLMRFGRNNKFCNLGNQQPLGCGCIYMRDFLTESSLNVPAPALDRTKAIKYLLISVGLQFIDYGYEMAVHFKELGLLSQSELDILSNKSFWLGWRNIMPMGGITKSPYKNAILRLLRLIPANIRTKILNTLAYTFK